MNTCSFAAIPALFLLAAGVLAPDTAVAGDVYQCIGGVSTIYQDQPCPESPNKAPRLHYAESEPATGDATESAPKPANAFPAADANLKRGMEIYTGLQQSEQDRTQVEKARQAEIDAAQQRYKGNKVAADAEVRAIAQRWDPQMKEVLQRQDAFAAQAHEVCPNSAAIGSDGKCR